MGKKIAKGQMSYELTIGENIDIRYEQSNENHLVSFVAVQNNLKEILQIQKNIPPNKKKMSKSQILNIERTIKTIQPFVSELGMFLVEKYRDVPVEKPKIEIINPLLVNLPKDLKNE